MASDFADRSREYRDALYLALAGQSIAVRDADPVILLKRLAESAMPAAASSLVATELLGELGGLAAADSVDAAVTGAQQRFETPAAMSESIYFARCLQRDGGAIIALLEGRRYLQTAAVPVSFAELRTDRDAVLDATTFALLWGDDRRAGWMQGVIDIWKRDYAAVYGARHESFRTSATSIADRIDGESGKAAALERLNGLERLGAPVAVAALEQFHDLERIYPCAVAQTEVNARLATLPVCPSCGFDLTQTSPVADARRVISAINRGLTTQQSRLARRVVSRIIARRQTDEDARIENFLRVVQASDLAGLALVLDEGLVDFLRDLLDAPSATENVLAELALAFPEVTSGNVEAVVAEFRRLLQGKLSRDGRVQLSEGGL